MSTLSAQIWVINTILHPKEPGLLGEIVDSRTETEHKQNEFKSKEILN